MNNEAVTELVKNAMASGALWFAMNWNNLPTHKAAPLTDAFEGWAREFVATRTDLFEALTKPEEFDFAVGDRVRLTGWTWKEDEEQYAGPPLGSIHTINDVCDEPMFTWNESDWSIYNDGDGSDYSAELVKEVTE